MSEFLDQYTVAFEARMSDSRSNHCPSLTVWVIPIGAQDMDERRALMRLVFSQTPEHPNALAFYDPYGRVIVDTSEAGELPSGVNLTKQINLAWDGDEASVFMTNVADLVAGVSELMRLARTASILSGKDEQELFEQLCSNTGLHMKRCRQQDSGTYILEAQ